MSFEMMLSQQQLPAYLSSADDVDTGLGALVSVAPPRISTEGGMFTGIVDGNKVFGPLRELDVIVVGMFPEARTVSRVFYASAYVKGEASAPDCSSLRDDVPDAGVKSPQAAACKTCPQNIAGSSSNGKSRACGIYKRLAVMIPGIPLVFELRVSATGVFAKTESLSLVQGQPATSWHGLTAYASWLNTMASKTPSLRMDMSKVLTTLAFPKGQTEGLRFSAKNWADQADYNAAVEAIRNGSVADLLSHTEAAPVPPSGLPAGLPPTAAPAYEPPVPPVAESTPAYVPPAPAAPAYEPPVPPVAEPTPPPAPAYEPPVAEPAQVAQADVAAAKDALSLMRDRFANKG